VSAPGAYPVHCAWMRSHTIAESDTCQAATGGLEPTCLCRICEPEVVLRLASHALYLVATRGVGPMPDACCWTLIGTTRCWSGEVRRLAR